MTRKKEYVCPDLHILAAECSVICSSLTELVTMENEEIVILDEFVW